MLQKSVGSFGLAGLDRLLCFMIVKELQTFHSMCTRLLNNAKDRQYHDLLDSFSKGLGNVKAVVGQYYWGLFCFVCLVFLLFKNCDLR